MVDDSSISSHTVNTPWATALDRWLPNCLVCLFPKIHEKIDWNTSFERLESTLLVEHAEAYDDPKPIDLIYKVTSIEGEDNLIWIHLHQTITDDSEIGKKLFTLSRQLDSEYQQGVLPIVIHLNNQSTDSITHYQNTVLGFSTHRLDFQSTSLHQWADNEQALLSSQHPFERLLGIYLTSQAIENDPELQYQSKLDMHTYLMNHTTSKEDFLNYYEFLDLIMPLPEDFSQRYHESVYQLEREKKVSYLTDHPRFGIDQWTHNGFQKGVAHIRRMVLKNMVTEGIEREKIKQVLGLKNISDKEFNQLLLTDHSGESLPSVTDSIEGEVQTL